MPDKEPIFPKLTAGFLKQSWPTLLLLIILAAAAAIFHRHLAIPSVSRASIVFALAAGLLYGSHRAFFPPMRDVANPLDVRFVIAFDSCIFIIVGLAATTLACNHWEVALLLGGLCLLVGGFFGLLFGYPQGVAQQTATTQKTPPEAQLPQAAAGGTAPVPQVPQATNTLRTTNRDKTLLADSAATLGKVIAGFTLAKAGAAYDKYAQLCHSIAPALGAQDPTTSHILAGALMGYFLATGFFSGLLLPSYFMSDRF